MIFFIYGNFFFKTTSSSPDSRLDTVSKFFLNIRGVIRVRNRLPVMDTPGSQLESHGKLFQTFTTCHEVVEVIHS
jgi:hypothetical protein